jgi:hypothetical protein
MMDQNYNNGMHFLQLQVVSQLYHVSFKTGEKYVINVIMLCVHEYRLLDYTT